MKIDGYNLERAEAQRRQLFDDAAERIRNSGAIDMLCEQLAIISSDAHIVERLSFEDANGGFPQVSVTGPTWSELHEDENGIHEQTRKRTLRITAPFGHPSLFISIWTENTTTDMDREGNTQYMPVGHSEYDRLLHRTKQEALIQEGVQHINSPAVVKLI